MQLSKRDFQKLSKADQMKLLKNSSKPKTSKKQHAGKGPGVARKNRGRETAPVAFSKRLTQFQPVERSKANGVRCIKFKEYVQDIAGSAAFAATAFACNPGLSNLFAWLSGQSLFYQEYTVKSLRFLFETEKATTLSGKVMFAFLQDSADPLPASKQEMLENLIKASGAVWEPFALPVSMGNFPALGKSRFIRSGNLAPNLDVKTYDIGQLIVGTQGMVDTSLVGELYIEYDIELRTPIQSSVQLAQALSAKVVSGGTVSQTVVFGTIPVITGGLDISVSAGTITFNKVGQYLVDIIVNGTGLHSAFNPTFPGSTATLTESLGFSNAAADIGTTAIAEMFVTVTARGQTMVVDCTAASTTVTSSVAKITTYAVAN